MKPVVLLERGEVIADRYKIDSPIGQGGMAVVYRARHQTSGKECALKLLQGRWLEEEGLLDRFLKEARILGRIGDNPHIVDVFDAGLDEQRGVPYIAMELLHGQTLDDYLRERSPVSHLVARAILTQVSRALEEAHRLGVVHRDLKPANIFVSMDKAGTPKIKVLDFGIAKDADHTRTATEVGTPGLEAPEQLGADIREYAATQGITITRGISPQTDIWALGLLAYRVFTGKSARQYWGENSPGALILAVAVGTRPRPSERAAELADNLPPGFDAWFLRCLDSDSCARWPSTMAAVAALFDESPPAAEGDDEAVAQDGTQEGTEKGTAGATTGVAEGETGDSGDGQLPSRRTELLTVAEAPQAKAVEQATESPDPTPSVRPDSLPSDRPSADAATPGPTGIEAAQRSLSTPSRLTARQVVPWLALALIVVLATLIGVLRPLPLPVDSGQTTDADPTASPTNSQPVGSATAGTTALPSATVPSWAAVSGTAAPGPSSTTRPPSTRPPSSRPPSTRPPPSPPQDEFDALFGDR